MYKNTDNLPILLFETQQDWEAWLKEQHSEAAGIWLKLAKKDAGSASLTYAEALESALCYGWIDGQKASFDNQYWLQKFTPRRPKSIWSQVNCEKATALIAAGRMQPAGLRQVELAKADGRWDQAYVSQSRITIPADFQSELDKNPEAQAFFSTLDGANRYAILFRIQTAKRAETRSARIQKFIEMLLTRLCTFLQTGIFLPLRTACLTARLTARHAAVFAHGRATACVITPQAQSDGRRWALSGA